MGYVETRVRFPSPAPLIVDNAQTNSVNYCVFGSLVNLSIVVTFLGRMNGAWFSVTARLESFLSRLLTRAFSCFGCVGFRIFSFQ